MNTNCHNVIVFGAGASADAGIPLMGRFVDAMWEMAMCGRVGETPIPQRERAILAEAIAIRLELERYHSRAAFDDRNLEDILSLLSFDALDGGSAAVEKYDKLVRAIAVTIELCCNLKYEPDTPEKPYDVSGASMYRALWHLLLTKYQLNLPAIVTFNYDLVLERALWQRYHRLLEQTPDLPVVGLRYHHSGNLGFGLGKEPHEYCFETFPRLFQSKRGERPVLADLRDTTCEVSYLKLHGSLNWPSSEPDPAGGERPAHPAQAVENPIILPPVFNKMNTLKTADVWTKALEILRRAKNLIIVGYSLPRTDIYMQYFLKAAIGPNSNLNRIFVFDPVLFKDDSEATELRSRYSACFSPQFQNRITFQPQVTGEAKGTFRHFVHLLGRDDNDLFFKP
jgi:hypothetical protein